MIPLGLGGVVQLTVKAVSLASIHRCGHTGGPGTAGDKEARGQGEGGGKEVKWLKWKINNLHRFYVILYGFHISIQ